MKPSIDPHIVLSKSNSVLCHALVTLAAKVAETEEGFSIVVEHAKCLYVKLDNLEKKGIL